jgi:hypothetical protein
MAATYDYTMGGTGGFLSVFGRKFYVITRVMDVADIIASDATMAAAGKIAATDTIKAINVPDDTLVLGTVTRVMTACTDTTATVDVGDGDDVEGFDAAVDITAAAGTNGWTNNDADAYSMQIASGKVYSAADTIDVLFNNDTTNGVFLVQALCVDLGYEL